MPKRNINRVLTDQPDLEVKSVVVTATDADGGVTTTTLSGDSISLELHAGGMGEGIWLGARMSGKKAVIRSHPNINGQFVARGVQLAEIEYIAPEKPAQRWKVGDYVRLTKSVLPANFPYRNRGWIGEVKGVQWLTFRKCWAYQFEDRTGRGLEVWDSEQLDGMKTVPGFPFTKGDFVTYHPSLKMGSDEIFKLLRRVGPSEDGFVPSRPAWWLSKENGPTATYMHEDQMQRINVRVRKSQTWTPERG
jgi:hypothetical protein